MLFLLHFPCFFIASPASCGGFLRFVSLLW
jgi:hypothetical protein